jgi:plasmid stabilization system protein ParE
MSRPPVPRLVLTHAASRAIIEQASYYAKREGQALADRWEAAVRKALESLPAQAAIGSRCNFRHPDLQNLRRMPVPGFPRHLIFYEDLRESAMIRVVHIMHGARDIEATLRTPLMM